MSKSGHPKSATGHISEPFYENSPRPPAVGEERDISHRGCSPVPFKYPVQQSGAHQPRRSALHGYVPQHSSFKDSAPMGFEPEGCSGGSRVFSESPPPIRSSPGYARWAQNLSMLLDDPEGVELFKKYVEQEGVIHIERLKFYFACEGVKNQTDPMKRKQMVEVVYRFLKKSQLKIPEDLKRKIKTALKDEHVSANIFDSMQTDVVRLINESTYPNFLRSETYIAHIQATENAEGCLGLSSYTPSDSCSSSGSSSAQMLSCSQSTNALPTLHEDAVLMLDERDHLQTIQQHSVTESPIRLTKSNIMATQRDRLEPMPRNEIFTTSSILSRKYSVYSHAHAKYSSYNPVSRQDSEIQSLSSGRTDSDNLSMSGNDGSHTTRLPRRQSSRNDRSISKYNMNTESLSTTVIPRTQRLGEKSEPNLKPELFAAILTEKLELIKREQDTKEKLDRRLENTEGGSNASAAPPKTLADAIREKLLLDDDNDQDILDQHVSRVWSDLTPSRSPGICIGGDIVGEASPRPLSPPGHYSSHGQSSRSNTHQQHLASKHKDHKISMFSIDSGNVQDYYDGSQLSGSPYGSGDHRHRTSSSMMSKSRSIPDCDVFVRHNIARRSSSKRTVADYTDSGVSVISEYPPIFTRSRDTKAVSRSMESQSSDRRRREHNNPPTQPYLTDRSIPVPQPPNTATQLEEARKRLLMEDERGRQKQRYSSKVVDTASAQSTLRRSVRRPNVSGVSGTQFDIAQSSATSGEHTVVVFSFCDEEFPYRTKIPGTTVTLKQFKEVLPKRGNYRFFFKNICEELENQVIQEEIVNDADTLPLWEGKVMAQVKSCD